MAKKEELVVKPLYSTFAFVGKPVLSKEEFIKEIVGEKGTTYKVNFGIKTSDTNVIYVEMMSYVAKSNQKIFTLDKDNKKLEIDFKERSSKQVMDKVADFKKFKIQLGKEKKEFISEFDAIQELNGKIDKDMNYLVTGDIQYQRYYSEKSDKTLIFSKYIIKNVTVLTDTEKVKPSAKSTVEFIYNKESIDEGSFKDEKKIYYSVYVTAYDKESKKNLFIPINLVLNAEKVDMTNEQHKKQFGFLRDSLNIKDKKYYAFQVDCNVFRGVDKKTIAYDDLTDFEKGQVDLDIKTLDEIARSKPSDSVAGDKINEIRIIKPGSKKAYTDGKIEVDYTDIDFILTELKSNREKLTIIEDETPPFEIDRKDDVDLDLDDLFGGN